MILLFALLLSAHAYDATQLRCAAAHYACVHVGVSKLPSAWLHREICHSCASEQCKCDPGWCSNNGYHCFIHTGGGWSNWSATARACAAAHAACKHAPATHPMKGSFCATCRAVCTSQSCETHWCPNDAQACENEYASIPLPLQM